MSTATPDRKIVHGVCPHDCPDTCGMRITVEDGRAVRVEGDPTHPITRGFLCVKVNQYVEHVYSDRRILTPHRRVGPKGSGQFAPISWDEALDEIAARFGAIVEQHGGEAILPYSYSGTLGLVHNYSMDYRFFYRLGATLLQRTICTAAAVEGHRYTLGNYYGTDPEHFPDAKLIICWGTNPVTSNPHMMPFIKAAQDNGATLVVIDPRRTRTAERADWHLQPNPGSDGTYADRLDTLKTVRDAGLKVCCGGIIGLGEADQDRIELLHTLATLPEHPDSVPVNQLVQVAGTPLGAGAAAPAAVDPLTFVRVIAVARILMPRSRVRLSAGRTDMSDELQALCFFAGANSIFYGEQLLTTPNPGTDRDLALLARLGLKPAAMARA